MFKPEYILFGIATFIVIVFLTIAFLSPIGCQPNMKRFHVSSSYLGEDGNMHKYDEDKCLKDIE